MSCDRTRLTGRLPDRGKPAHVLLSIEEYQRITGKSQSISDALGWPAGVEDIEIEFPRSRELARPVDLS